MPGKDLRAAPRSKSSRGTRANRVFATDEKRIRSKNTVLIKSKDGIGFLYKIVDCARMRFSSVRNRRSARTDSSSAQQTQLGNNGDAFFSRYLFHDFQSLS